MATFKIILLLLMCIELPEWCRTQNCGPNCLWACVNTIGRLHDIPEIKHALLDRQREDFWKGFKGADNKEVEEFLKRQGANYRITWWNSKGKSFVLLNEFANTHGVVVSFYAGWRKGWACHAVLVTEWSDKEVQYWDPNFPNRIFTWDRQSFDYWYTGQSLVVLPKEK